MPPEATERTVIRSWKAPIALLVFTALYGLLLVLAPRDGVTTFRLSTDADAIQLPDVVVPVMTTAWICFVVLVLLTLAAAYFVRAGGRTPLWVSIVYVLVGVFGFLTWAAAGATIPVSGLLGGIAGARHPAHLRRPRRRHRRTRGHRQHRDRRSAARRCLHAPRSSRRSRASPSSASWPLRSRGSSSRPCSRRSRSSTCVDQVIVGVVLNVLVTGLTSFFFTQVLQPNAAQLNAPPRFPRIPIPFLSEIPVIGPVFFRQTIIVYLVYVAVAVVYVGMFHTRWGLRLRAVGEHPQAADTVGIKVNATRFWNVLLAGAIAGIGGTVFTIGNGIAFNKEMTAGAGFIALAAVIFGQWDPIKATLAALLFGFASSLQNTLNIIGSPVPSEFMLMLPYLVTIFVVAGVVGKSRAPAADGKPYIKG